MQRKIYEKFRLFIVLPAIALIAVGFLAIIGCDEAGMVEPVVPVDGGTEPVEPVEPTTEPTTNGDVKQPEEPTKPEPEPTPEPTVAIRSAAQQDDGSIVVSGMSTDVPEGTTVTVTLGGTVTATATTDANGNWTTTVPAEEAEKLSAGTVTVTAVAKEATVDSSFEYTVQTTYGIPTPTEEDRVKVEIFAGIVDPDEEEVFVLIYEGIDEDYGTLFDLETEVGRETFKRFVEYDYKQILLSRNPPASFDKKLEILDQYFEEAYGISAEYSDWLVHKVYLDEKPEDEYLLGVGWQTESIAMEHLLLRIANPNATEEEILELLRESIRAGRVTIA